MSRLRIVESKLVKEPKEMEKRKHHDAWPIVSKQKILPG
jgi:hypothetical protein